MSDLALRSIAGLNDSILRALQIEKARRSLGDLLVLVASARQEIDRIAGETAKGV
jgi:hypothetical protein